MLSKVLFKSIAILGTGLSLITFSTTKVLADEITISVINNSGKEMTAIYISAPDQDDWGENELDAPIADRGKVDFSWNQEDYGGSDAGCIFDVRAEYSDGKSTDLDKMDLCKEASLNFN
jgi:hypothetical protein